MLVQLSRMLSDTRGNFGIITALLMVPLVGAAGLALDISHALFMRTQLYNAADAAAVGAITPNSMAVTKAMQMPGNGTIDIGAEDARKLFLQQMSGKDADLPLEVEVSVTKENGTIESRVTFNATVPTTLMKVLGRNTVTVGGTVSARYQMPAFIDFYMLLDNTPSMGVAATPGDVEKMEYVTRHGNASGGDKNCAFACHIVSEAGIEDKSSYYNVAKNNGITIRIDVVAQATAALMATAEKTQTVKGQFRVAAYTFGKTAQDASLYKVAELSESLSTVASATDKIKLMSIPYQNYDNDQQTSFDDALTRIEKEVKGVPGSGSSAADRQKIVFFVADGVGDSRKPSGCTSPKGKVDANRCIEPIDTKYCTKLKERNIRIAVLYTTYLPLPKNDFWNKWVKPFDTSIGAKMHECASPGYYFEVSPEEGISQAMNALFKKIVSTPRLTS
ncbi:pilus assembly protein TadG-related protein [Pseudorhizobium flavum]|uniref:Flp pilus assembly protein TadG n=1 Tax=Pseudorhizobium flavum TaxID=1335061 RepID=A0A7W9YUM5_9HYPH|nr:pilus assembly protein TadG-related protein [Pseudorhizobium flavum]MBB6178705.1 Flp pilus assembly protein TadG [Pseudorhizobium flavum]CAD6608826.1 membrane protein [Pseudorhizobium flavum]